MFKFSQESENKNEFLSFLLDGDPYCINVGDVQEIIYVPAISKIPNVPIYIEGVINLRGKVLRVLNLRKWLRLPFKTITQKSRIIIVQQKEGIFGILVDEVQEVFRADPSLLREIPSLLQQDPEISYLNSMILKNKTLFCEINSKQLRV